MANRNEFLTLQQNYTADTVAAAFGPAYVGWGSDEWWYITDGRINESYDPPGDPIHTHIVWGVRRSSVSEPVAVWSQRWALNDDCDWWSHVGAWVVSQERVVPAPGALILTATGLLYLLGLKRFRSKHQE
jgi:hypothetical protein